MTVVSSLNLNLNIESLQVTSVVNIEIHMQILYIASIVHGKRHFLCISEMCILVQKIKLF